MCVLAFLRYKLGLMLCVPDPHGSARCACVHQGKRGYKSEREAWEGLDGGYMGGAGGRGGKGNDVVIFL